MIKLIDNGWFGRSFVKFFKLRVGCLRPIAIVGLDIKCNACIGLCDSLMRPATSLRPTSLLSMGAVKTTNVAHQPVHGQFAFSFHGVLLLLTNH